MNVLTIMAYIPRMTIIALMATMTNDHCRCDSLNNYESCYIGDNSLYGYGHNGSSGHNRCNDHIDCNEYIVVMTKHLLVAVLSVMTLIAGIAV